MRMTMVSDPNTTAGVWLTYLAVSAGYDLISAVFSEERRLRVGDGISDLIVRCLRPSFIG